MSDVANLDVPPPEPTHRCDTCRWWDMHSLDMKEGDCRVPSNHRYSRYPIETRRPDGTIYRSFALFDSFGAETTRPDYVCGAWDDGHQEQRLALLRALHPEEGQSHG